MAKYARVNGDKRPGGGRNKTMSEIPMRPNQGAGGGVRPGVGDTPVKGEMILNFRSVEKGHGEGVYFEIRASGIYTCYNKSDHEPFWSQKYK